MPESSKSSLHEAVKTLTQRFGTGIVSNADNFSAVLEDWAEEGDAAQAALLVDAVRYGALEQLQRVMAVPGSDATAAVNQAAEHMVSRRGGTDPSSARWAVAVLGSALNLVPESLVAAPAGGPPPPHPPSPPPPPPHLGDLSNGQPVTVPGGPLQGGGPWTPGGAMVPPTPPYLGPGPSGYATKSRKTFWIVLGSAVAVLAVIGGVLAVVVAGGGDDDKNPDPDNTSKTPPTSPSTTQPPTPSEPERITTDVLTVAQHFSSLGNLSNASSCRSEVLTTGYKEIVVCSYSDYDVRLAETADQATLDAESAPFQHPVVEPDLSSATTGPAGTFAQLIYNDTGDGDFPLGATELYWNSMATLMSASVVNADQNPSANAMREWYNSVGSQIPAPAFDIAPFVNVDLYLWANRNDSTYQPGTCEVDKDLAREFKLNEYVRCDGTEGFSTATFSVTDNLSAYREDSLPERSNTDDNFVLKYQGAYTYPPSNHREGIYRIYLACSDPCEVDEDVYTWGYVDDDDTGTVIDLYSFGSADTKAMKEALGF